MTSRILEMFGRVLIAFLFVPAGIAKFTAPAPFLAHMAAHGVPGSLLPLVGLLEITAGLALLTGLWIRAAALILGFFCILTAFLFHLNLADHVERTQFLKDLAIAGGLFAFGSLRPTVTPLSIGILWRRQSASPKG